MRKKHKDLNWTYRGWNLSEGGKQEPDDTLFNGNRISEWRSVSENRHRPTCFHSRRPKANVPPPWRRSLSKPKSIMRNKAISVMSVTTILSLLLSVLRDIQLSRSGDLTARIYEQMSSRSRTVGVRLLFTLVIPKLKDKFE